VTALREAADFFVWRDDALNEYHGYTGPDLTALYRKLLSGLHNYEIPAVVIDPSIPPAGIARIFERVNRLGMRLGTFDLMVAKSFHSNFNLRLKWEEARKLLPRLDAFFGDDGLAILNVIALRTREDVGQKAVLDMPGSAVRDGWEKATSAMDRAIDFLSRVGGVWSPDWLPYRNIATIVAALSYDGGDVFIDREMLHDWYWKTVFGRRYDVASNTRSVADYKALLSGKNPVPGRAVLVREDLIECNKKQFGSLHRAFLCLLASCHPRDLCTGEPLESGEFERERFPDVRTTSLFQRDATEKGPAALHLRTLGMVLASQESERLISTLSMRDVSEEVLASQLVPRRVDIQPSEQVLASRLRSAVNRLIELTESDFRLVERDV